MHLTCRVTPQDLSLFQFDSELFDVWLLGISRNVLDHSRFLIHTSLFDLSQLLFAQGFECHSHFLVIE